MLSLYDHLRCGAHWQRLVVQQTGGWLGIPGTAYALEIVVSLQGAGSFAIKRLPFVDRLIPISLKS